MLEPRPIRELKYLQFTLKASPIENGNIIHYASFSRFSLTRDRLMERYKLMIFHFLKYLMIIDFYRIFSSVSDEKASCS